MRELKLASDFTSVLPKRGLVVYNLWSIINERMAAR
jgi:hypothetical protein